MPAFIPFLIVALPAVSASLLTAGRFVAMTAIPAAFRFATAPSTLSAAGTVVSGAGTAAKVVMNNKMLVGGAVLTADGVLGTNMAATAVKGLVSGVSTVGGATLEGAKNNAKDIDKSLTGGKLTSAFDAPATGTSPEGKADPSKLATPQAGAAAPAGTAAGAEETVAETDEQGNTRRVPKSQSGESKMQAMMNGVLDKLKGDPIAAGFATIGGIYGMSKSNGMAEAAWKIPLYAMMFGVLGKIFGPMLAPLIGLDGSSLKQSFTGASVGKEQSAAPADLQQAPAGPVADTNVKAANESKFRQNADDVTGIKLVDGDTRVDLRNRPPVRNYDHFALQA